MRALRSTAGQTAAEYLGMLLVTAAILAVIAQSDIPGRLRYELVRTVCLALNEEQVCDPPYKVERRRRDERRTLLAQAASRRDRDRKAREGKHGRRRIYDARGGVDLRKRLVRSNGDGPSHRAEADRVFRNLGTIYDYWHNTFGRRSYDGRNGLIVAAINFDPRYGAGWDPRAHQLVLSKGFGAPLDVVAHEFAHGVMLSELPGFSHKGENGALGEAIADMFASNLDTDDWEIGEDLPSGTRRDMKDPHKHKTGSHRHAATTGEYVVTDDDQGGVHINAGIPNRAYVAMVESLGRAAAQRILYDAVTEHLSADAGFEDFRKACLKASTAQQRDAVDAAFATVGLDGTWRPKD